MKFGTIEIPRSVSGAVANARLAEAAGFDLVGVADSQSVFREAYVTAAMILSQTTRVRVGPTVTNAITRHPAVAASAIATLNEIGDGRCLFGIGSGDSAILNLGEKPFNLAGMRSAVETMKALLRGQHVEWQGREIHTQWVPRPLPVYIAAEGPKTLELAGEVADGVICGLGLEPEIVARCLEHLRQGAERAGRSLEDLDIWAMARVNVGTDRNALIRGIRMELASTAHHAFRFTLEGKQVPPAFHDAIRRVQSGYQPRQHEAHGESPNAQLIGDPEFLEYMAQRFAILGTPKECAEQIRRVGEAGISNILFTGFVEERQALIRTLGDSVFPLV